MSRYTRLATAETEIVLDAAIGGRAQIAYWGPPLRHTTPDEIAALGTRQWVHGGPSIDVPPSLSNEIGAGANIAPGLACHRDGLDWAVLLVVQDVQTAAENHCAIICADKAAQLRVRYDLALDEHSHVLTASTTITNLGETPLAIDWCTALCIPLDAQLTRLKGFTGRWAMEFQEQIVPAFHGSYLRENTRGRTSHDSCPGLIAMSDGCTETSGCAAGFHLGWSGNHGLRVDRRNDGRAFVQMGELFLPGEMRLSANESYTTPPLYAARSEHGLNRLSQQFHHHVKRRVLDGRNKDKPRPVHFNTWEAVYFDLNEERLLALAEKAAAVGAERFVLDDGWFGARRNDAVGLGDWRVSKDAFPNGLAALADRVRELGMAFGLWFEPEMVNPDSDLYRAHPDWVLGVEGAPNIPARNQLALDLSQPEVSDYLFGRMSAIIREYSVDYIKWDMNRDIQHPGSGGRAAIHKQTHAVYALMRRLRDAHPALEIESCASGGGRCDYGVLRHTDRLWISDSNDALDRQRILRGASYFFPLRVMGGHVGPADCHITGRRHSMAFRVASAFFGHMGMELNLFDERDEDLETLRAGIALHKQHRALIHEGDFFRVDAPADLNIVGVVSRDESEALFSYASMASAANTLPGRIRLPGLDPAKRYRMRIIWPTQNISPTGPSIIEKSDLLGDGAVFSGEALAHHGMQPPVIRPEQCLIYHLRAEGAARALVSGARHGAVQVAKTIAKGQAGEAVADQITKEENE